MIFYAVSFHSKLRYYKSVQPPTLLLLTYLPSLRSDTVSPPFENDDPFRLSTLCLTFSKPILHVWCRNFGDVFTSLLKHGLVVTNSTAELSDLPWEATTRHFTTPPWRYYFFLPPRFWVETWPGPTRVSVSTKRQEKRESLGSRL